MSTIKDDLAQLIRSSTAGIVDVELAATAWSASRSAAAMRLARLTKQGWLTRLRRGVYYALPLESARADETTIADPWLVASKVFAPCYVAGWSAAEHWGLTEQLFRSTFVATTAHIRERQQILFGAEYHLARITPDRLEGLATVWRGSTRVALSSPERAIVDAMRTPSWIGGVRHLEEVLVRWSELKNRSEQKLIGELRAHGNGAAAKRLGLMAERVLGEASPLVAQCLAMRSAGVIKLDPGVKERGRLNSRWRIWVNVSLSA